jgi:hypothetical protein
LGRIKEVAADTKDAIEVLREQSLYPKAVRQLRKALALEKLAGITILKRLRNTMLATAAKLKDDASDMMLGEPE